MRFKLFKTEIYISFGFCALFCFMLCTDKTGLIIPTAVSVILHEAAHLFVMYINDCAPVEIYLIPASVKIVKSTFISDKKSIAVLLAGPLFNLALSLTLFLNYSIYKREYIVELSVINAALGIFNLLPVCGLDGGDILKILLSKRLSCYTSENILRCITAFFGLSFFAFGAYMTVKKTVNPSVFIAALYFVVCAAAGK